MIIITGHGKFGYGLKSSLNFIVGENDSIKFVDFTEEKSPESLKEEIKRNLKETNDKVYIFTDLLGGTPFKVSSELALENSNIEVLCGTNLPMLVEASMMISLGLDIDIDSIKDAGINNIRPQVKKVEVLEDGI